jgi:protein O-mannosyl-transferase
METLEIAEQTRDEAIEEFRPFHAPQKHRLILCLLLVLATLALYNPVTHAPFLNVDDFAYVTDNPHVRAGLSWETVVWAFHTTEATNWHPITWLSHAADCQIFGLKPAGPHYINVILHAANGALLFLILLSATGFVWRSLAVAALFSLHPINVESVAWIAERKNVLSTLFFLLALAGYGWYARRPGIGRYLAVTLAYALGLMTKPQVIAFPCALLLLDYWPLNRVGAAEDEGGLGTPTGRQPSIASLLWEKAPWFLMSAASAVITMRVQRNATEANLPLWVHIGNAAISYVKYVEKALWPVNLAPVYPHPQLSINIPAAVMSVFAIVAISILAVIYREHRPFFVGWFWFLGTLVPMIGLVQVGIQAMADRYAYIAMLGIFVIVCWGAASLLGRWKVPVLVGAAGATVIFLALAVGLHRQVGYWSDNVTLWAHTLEVTEGNYAAEENIATALLVDGKDAEALPHLQRARRLRPDDPLLTLNIANYERLHGNYAAALDDYAKISQLTKKPDSLAAARLQSGYARLALKQYDRARQDFEASLRQQPIDAGAYRALGLLAQRAGDIMRASQDYERSVEIEPTPVSYLLLAQALEIGGQAEAARAAQSRAARMSLDLGQDSATVKQLLTI